MIVAMLSLLSAFAAPASADVRATLADGQVLFGDVRTRTLRLETGAGVLDVPLADVGEVVPASGGHLQGAEGLVDVWLRNGSELRGRWSDPKLAVDVAVGGRAVTVDLPMNELARFQLQGGARWPGGPVYRMRTAWGDDFLVDPSKTTLVVENHLGTFAPKLSECRSLAPVADPTGDWRIELMTGTVLIGQLQDDAVTVALPMGPKEVTVPLASFVSLRVESWEAPRRVAAVATPAPVYAESMPVGLAAAPAHQKSSRGAPASRRAEHVATGVAADATTEDGWFDNAALEASKRESGDDGE